MQSIGIQSASLEIEDRRRRAHIAARRREIQAEGRAELERLIEEVEEANLERAPRPPDLHRRLKALAGRIMVPAPRSVWNAASGPRLHEALMDWEDALLERVAPHRLRYVDRHE